MSVFEGRNAIVTGSGSGIGRALALELGRAGSRVAVTDIRADRVDAVVDELKGLGADARGYVVDHSKLDAVRDLAQKFEADFGDLDILCSNAGVGHGGRVEEMTIEDWEWVMKINLWGSIYMIQTFVPKMIERREGRILITASGLGIIPAPGMSPYTTSKYAMVGLAESLRCELYKHNVRVSVLCPGIINTNIVDDGRIKVFDEAGESAQSKVSRFYKERGTDPSVVARHAMKALRRDIGIMPTPFHVWPAYSLHRLSPSLFHAIGRFLWRKGWIV